MYYTPNLKLTQYEMNDKFNPLEQYNRDMEIIDVTTTSISNAVVKVTADSKNNYIELRSDIDVNTSSISAMEVRLVNAEDDIKVNKEESEKAINALQLTTSSISAAIMQHIVTSTSVVAGIYEAIDTKYEELKTQQLADEQRIAVNETAIANHQELLDKLNLDGTETGDAIEELQEAIQALQNVDSSTAESIQDLRTRMSSAEANILTDGTDIDALEARMTTAEENIEDLGTLKLVTIDASTIQSIQKSGFTISANNPGPPDKSYFQLDILSTNPISLPNTGKIDMANLVSNMLDKLPENAILFYKINCSIIAGNSYEIYYNYDTIYSASCIEAANGIVKPFESDYAYSNAYAEIPESKRNSCRIHGTINITAIRS